MHPAKLDGREPHILEHLSLTLWQFSNGVLGLGCTFSLVLTRVLTLLFWIVTRDIYLGYIHSKTPHVVTML